MNDIVQIGNKMQSKVAVSTQEVRNSLEYQKEQEIAEKNNEYVDAFYFFNRFFTAFYHLGYEALKRDDSPINIDNFKINLNKIRRHPHLSFMYLTALENHLTSIFAKNTINAKQQNEESIQLFNTIQREIYDHIERNNILMDKGTEIQEKIRGFVNELKKRSDVTSKRNFCMIENNEKMMNYRLWQLKEFLLLTKEELEAKDWLYIGNFLRNIIYSHVGITIDKEQANNILHQPLFYYYSDNDIQDIKTSFTNLASEIIQNYQYYHKDLVEKRNVYQKELIEKGVDVKESEEMTKKYYPENILENILLQTYSSLIKRDNTILKIEEGKKSVSLWDIMNDVQQNLGSQNSEKKSKWIHAMKVGFLRQHEIQPSFIYT